MKILLLLAFTALFAVAYSKPQDKRTTTNLNEILKSDALLKNYLDCLLDKGNCTPDAAELKGNLPDALANDCSKCSERQKNGSRQVIRYLIKNKHEAWGKLEAKYDPNQTYVKKYEDELKMKGISL